MALSITTERSWHVRPGGLVPVHTTSELQRLLLTQRGITPDSTASFLKPIYDRDIHDPYLLVDMAAAVERIMAAIRKQEMVVVYGDYDADGVSSTAIMLTALAQLGLRATPFLPHRHHDGYGINQNVLQRLLPELDLLITVDCGISNAEEIAWLKGKKIDTIIIDHHTVPATLPPARAIIHPQHPHGSYPSPWLCGAGTAWKVATALLRHASAPTHGDPDAEKWLLDLALLGTVADIVPLKGENRAIVSFGLEVLRRTKRPGLKALLSATRCTPESVSADDVAFRLVPRLNAAGRIDHPEPALELLLTDNLPRAAELSGQLALLNQQRQTLTRRILREADALVTDGPFVFAYSPTWPAGVVGLAASKLAKQYDRPAIVIGSNGHHAVGSARSPKHMNVLRLLQAGEAALLKLGGHAQAAGFSLDTDKIDLFREQLTEHTSGSPVAPVSATLADTVIGTSLIHHDTVATLEQLAPFGEGNPRPTFILRKLDVATWRPVGKEQQHAKFTFSTGDQLIDGIGFSLVPTLPPEINGRAVDVVGTVEHNEFRGRRTLQIAVNEVALAGTVTISESPQHESHAPH